MRKLVIAALMITGLMVPSAEAGIITGSQVTLTGSLGTLGGGAFTAVSPDSDSFFTFCLERNEYISYNTTYYAKLDMAAVGGGIGGGSPDYISSQTAYLYSLVVDGYFGPLNSSIADGLQLAFWRLENEVDSSYSGLGSPTTQGLANTYYDLAMKNAVNGSYYGVMVMQLWGSYNPTTGAFSGNKQDQLVRVPDGGLTLTLLGGALVGLGVLRPKTG
jgi:hypothetical protein